MNPPWTWAVASAPCLAQWCWHIPWVLAYSWPQSGHATQLPVTQAFVCAVHILLVASTFPHLLHGNFHHSVPPCEPSSGGGFWKTFGTLDSLSSLWLQQEFGRGPLQLPWPGLPQASPPHEEELTPAAWPISRLSSSPLLHHQQGKALVAQELEQVHQIIIWLPWVWQADPQPCPHLSTQPSHHPQCLSDVPPSTWTPSELSTPAPTSAS